MKSDKEMFFEKIVEENKNIIYTICYMFSKNNDEIADLFQSVLINIWYGLRSFRNESEIKTWIYRIALNTCISWKRKKKRISTIPLETNINLFEDKDEDTKQIQMLYNRINKLGVFDRAIVLLWLENQSYEDIATIMGISVKNVSVRLVRIREQLKKMSN